MNTGAQTFPKVVLQQLSTTLTHSTRKNKQTNYEIVDNKRGSNGRKPTQRDHMDELWKDV